ncbi:MAG TPA: LPS assembly lipoprotein LptE [Myxococcota bacterium]|nr:LPS assembly lipoprotein LptE [Myxococcota bacterium]
MSSARLWATFALALFASPACGYHALSGAESLGPNVHSIELKALENETREPGLETLVGEAMNEEFTRRGWLKSGVQGELSDPDLIMMGTLRTANYHSSSYSAGALALEESIDISLDLKVERAATKEVIWHDGNLHVREVFLSSADPGIFASNKEQALRRLSSEIAQRVHDELFQKF